ncbi:hypothetical protein CEXT_193381 [Caerostris extrusa]|uniref:Uncharacterized protein n=1 Tax=Caerostris extrusa TaxID=172846 RepID=A0AAV4RTA0_CAEEX|nr:hypothetical protein CEXT_193381 [Caerostris extrusa]
MHGVKTIFSQPFYISQISFRYFEKPKLILSQWPSTSVVPKRTPANFEGPLLTFFMSFYIHISFLQNVQAPFLPYPMMHLFLLPHNPYPSPKPLNTPPYQNPTLDQSKFIIYHLPRTTLIGS